MLARRSLGWVGDPELPERVFGMEAYGPLCQRSTAGTLAVRATSVQALNRERCRAGRCECRRSTARHRVETRLAGGASAGCMEAWEDWLRPAARV